MRLEEASFDQRLEEASFDQRLEEASFDQRPPFILAPMKGGLL
jgi:hypothetical protein